MNKLEDVKKRAEERRVERQNIYQEAIEQAMHRVLSGSEGILVLNAISQKGSALFDSPEVADQFVKTMAGAVTRSITNPVDNFLMLCKSRGLTERHVRVAVTRIYETYFIEFNGSENEDADFVDYKVKLEAVAKKLELEQNLWEELPILQKYDNASD